MTHDEMIAVIEAYKKGRTIQYFSKNTNKWYDCEEEPSWDFHSTQFRVKPSEEPTPQEETITKEWLQEKIDLNASSAEAYYALGNITQYHYLRGQQDVCIILLDIMYHIQYPNRVFPLDEKKRKDVIDSIFDYYKPYGKKKNP